MTKKELIQNALSNVTVITNDPAVKAEYTVEEIETITRYVQAVDADINGVDADASLSIDAKSVIKNGLIANKEYCYETILQCSESDNAIISNLIVDCISFLVTIHATLAYDSVESKAEDWLKRNSEYNLAKKLRLYKNRIPGSKKWLKRILLEYEQGRCDRFQKITRHIYYPMNAEHTLYSAQYRVIHNTHMRNYYQRQLNLAGDAVTKKAVDIVKAVLNEVCGEIPKKGNSLDDEIFYDSYVTGKDRAETILEKIRLIINKITGGVWIFDKSCQAFCEIAPVNTAANAANTAANTDITVDATPANDTANTAANAPVKTVDNPVETIDAIAELKNVNSIETALHYVAYVLVMAGIIAKGSADYFVNTARCLTELPREIKSYYKILMDYANQYAAIIDAKNILAPAFKADGTPAVCSGIHCDVVKDTQATIRKQAEQLFSDISRLASAMKNHPAYLKKPTAIIVNSVLRQLDEYGIDVEKTDEGEYIVSIKTVDNTPPQKPSNAPEIASKCACQCGVDRDTGGVKTPRVFGEYGGDNRR